MFKLHPFFNGKGHVKDNHFTLLILVLKNFYYANCFRQNCSYLNASVDRFTFFIVYKQQHIDQKFKDL